MTALYKLTITGVIVFLFACDLATCRRLTQGICYFGGIDEYGTSPNLYAQIVNPVFHTTVDFNIDPDDEPVAQASVSLYDDGWKNQIFICGGRKSNGLISNVCFSIVTLLDKVAVEIAPNLTQARAYHSATIVNQFLYICGGLSKVSRREADVATCEKLDVSQCHQDGCKAANVVWTASPFMQISRYGHVALTMSNTQFCVFGGRQGVVSSISSALIIEPTLLASVECYDTTTGQWSTKPPMPNKRTGHAGVLLNGMAYFCGGTFDADTATDTCVMYNPITEIWSQAGTLAAPRVDHVMVVFRGEIYVIGGITGDQVATDSIERYNYVKGKSEIITDKLNGARTQLAAVSILF